MKYILGKKPKIILIWHLAINPHNVYRDAIINGQIDDIQKSGILEEGRLGISLMCENAEMLNNYHRMLKMKLNIKVVEIRTTIKNEFEYSAFKLMYDLCKIYKESYFVYFHTKGMFFNNSPKDLNNDNRPKYENALTKYTINPHKIVLKIFEENPAINKVGLFPSSNNCPFMWMNFFWVRSTYLQNCSAPVSPFTENLCWRYIYESWLYHGYMLKNNLEKGYCDGYSLISKSNKPSDFTLMDDIGLDLLDLPLEYNETYLMHVMPRHVIKKGV